MRNLRLQRNLKELTILFINLLGPPELYEITVRLTLQWTVRSFETHEILNMFELNLIDSTFSMLL